MIVEEAADYLAELARAGLAPIFLAAPTSPDERLEAIATHSKGFVYAISRVGITGTQQALASDAAALVARIRRWTSLPVAVGFGISNSEHVAQVGQFAIYQGPSSAFGGAGPVTGHPLTACAPQLGFQLFPMHPAHSPSFKGPAPGRNARME